MEQDLSLWIAFIAGVISFFSPCFFVVAPAFLAHLAGVTVSQSTKYNWAIVSHTIAFCFGFIIIFTTLGASLGLLSSLLNIYMTWIVRLVGLVLIFFGLISLGIIDYYWFSGKK